MTLTLRAPSVAALAQATVHPLCLSNHSPSIQDLATTVDDCCLSICLSEAGFVRCPGWNSIGSWFADLVDIKVDCHNFLLLGVAKSQYNSVNWLKFRCRSPVSSTS